MGRSNKTRNIVIGTLLATNVAAICLWQNSREEAAEANAALKQQKEMHVQDSLDYSDMKHASDEEIYALEYKYKDMRIAKDAYHGALHDLLKDKKISGRTFADYHGGAFKEAKQNAKRHLRDELQDNGEMFDVKRLNPHTLFLDDSVQLHVIRRKASLKGAPSYPLPLVVPDLPQ